MRPGQHPQDPDIVPFTWKGVHYIYRFQPNRASFTEIPNWNAEGNDLRIFPNLSYGYFPNAKFARANLAGVNLSFAQLSGADLQGADLRDTNLTGTKLLDTKLAGAIMNERTIVEGANVSRTVLAPEADVTLIARRSEVRFGTVADLKEIPPPSGYQDGPDLVHGTEFLGCQLKLVVDDPEEFTEVDTVDVFEGQLLSPRTGRWPFAYIFTTGDDAIDTLDVTNKGFGTSYVTATIMPTDESDEE